MSSASQIWVSVVNRTARALPVLRIERLASVIPPSSTPGPGGPDRHFGTVIEPKLALRGFEAIGGTDLTIPPPALVAQAIPYSAKATRIATAA